MNAKNRNKMKKVFLTTLVLLITYAVKAQTNDKVLFIVSNAKFYGESEIPTANHFAEIIQPYDVLHKAEFSIDFMSPEGGKVYVGYIDESVPLEKKYLDDVDFMNKMKHTKKPSAITISDYKAVYYVGGGAAMFGVPENKEIQKMVMELYEEHDGIVSAVCHGSAGIVNLKTKDGKYLFEGKKVNGYPDMFETMDDEYYENFPFSIEQTIKERGGDFQFSDKGWDGFMVYDGRLITGQDPTAAGLIAEKLVEMLKNAISN